MAGLINKPKLWIGGLLAAVNIVVALSSCAWLIYSKDRYHQDAAANATNITRTVEISVTAVVRSIDLALQSMAREIASCSAPARSGCGRLDKILENHGVGLSESQLFLFANAEGLLTAGFSLRMKLPRPLADVRDREYFQHLRAHPTAGLVISPPQVGKITKRWALNLARPVVDSEGRFLGAVIASLDLESLQGMLAAVDTGAHGALSLRDGAMGVILRFPEPKGIGTNIGSRNISPQLAALLKTKASAGSYRAVTPLDGIERTVAFTLSPAYPLYVNVGLAAEDYLAPWYRERNVATALYLLLLAVTGVTGWLLWRMYDSQAREIALRTAAEEKLASLLEEQQAILQSDVVGIVMTRQRQMIWMNQAYAHMLGYGRDELTHRPTRILYPSEEAYRAFKDAAYPLILAGKVFRTQVRYLRKDGTLGWFDVSGARLRPGAEDSIWAFVDISVQKHTESRLIEAQQAAEQANVAKSRFLATMSHEIRTPMNGILGMAQLLLMPDLSPGERQEFARTILNSGQTLLALLNDILDLSRVEAGRVELKHAVFDPRQVVEETVALFAEPAHAKRLEFGAGWRGRDGQRYVADPIRIRQMLANLVSNAIKFTEQGFVRVEAAEVGRQGNEALLEFAVTDSGSGIAPAQQSLLFKPFSQVDGSNTRQYGGAGLGLSIVKSLAGLMGGEVGVESEAGKGARFWFRIRAAIPPEDQESRRFERPAGAGEKTGAPSGAQGNALVVEDNPTNRRVIEALLGKLGVRSVCVENGREAVEAITRGMRPDLVLMDVQMPVMDGLQATQEIRRWEAEAQRPHLAIVALTAGAFEEDRNRCLAAGMDDFLAKPVNMGDLAAILAKWGGGKAPDGPGKPAASPQAAG